MIYLVTDSTAYLSRQETRDLSVLVVPMHFIKDGTETFQEGFAEDYAPNPTEDLSNYSTAQAPTHAFQSLFFKLRRQGHQALCLTISSRLSGTFANALLAAQDYPEDVLVVDSRNTAGGLFLLLREARRMLDDGMSLQESFEALLKLRNRIRTVFTLQDMDPIRRSGRLGLMRSSVSTLLNLRPLLTLQDGSVVSHSLARGKQDQIRQMVLGLSGKPKEVIVQYCGDEDAAGILTERMQEKGIMVLRRRIGQVLAIHLGLPVLSTAWIDEKG